MFRCLMIFLFLVFVLVSMTPPVQAQDQSELTVIQRVITNDEVVAIYQDRHGVAPDQSCNPGCVLITLYHNCYSNLTLPTKQNDTFWQADIYRPDNQSHEDVYLEWFQDNWQPFNRQYDFYDLSYPLGSYYSRFTATSGTFAWWWTTYVGPKILTAGHSVVWDFYLTSHYGTYGC